MAKTPAVIKRLHAALDSDTPDMDALWQDINKAHTKHPELYQEWLPLFQASSHRENALRTTSNLEEFEACLEIVPRGCFNLRLGRYGTKNFTSAILKKVVSAKRAAHIPSLELHNHKKMSDSMFEILIDAKNFDVLKALTFASIHSMSLDHVEALLAAPCAESLEKLSIFQSFELGDQVIDVIQAAPHAEKLKTLKLSGVKLTGAALENLRTASKLPALTSLDITRNDQVDAASVVQLLESPFAAQLDTFWVDWSAIGDDGARAIANSPHMKKVENLVLKNAALSIEGVKALLTSENLPALKFLSVWGNNITYTDEELEAVKEEYADRVQVI